VHCSAPGRLDARQDEAADFPTDDCVYTRRSSDGSSVTPTTLIGDRVMGAMRKNAKKKAKQRAHAEKRKAQEEAIAGASQRHNAGGPQRPSPGRGT